jgi:hypothetical protein
MRHLPDIRAEIYPAGVDHAVVIQAGENAYREKVNAGEEGEWLDHYSQSLRRGLDAPGAADRTPGGPRQSASLHRHGDPKILAAVKEKKAQRERRPSSSIEFGARTIATTTSHTRYSGASVRLIKLWRAAVGADGRAGRSAAAD